MQKRTVLESVFRRDRGIVLGGLGVVSALAWAHIAYLSWGNTRGGMGMSIGVDGPQVIPWTAVDFGLMYLMWAVMMIAMMVPTAAPMILIFARVNRDRRDQKRPFVPTVAFLSGYLVIWFGFALVAALSQWGLHQAALMTSMMGSVTPALGGALLIAAGLFQWTPLKYVCVNQCRTPMGFVISEWRDGSGGALSMGLRHGAYCLGCCWFLMGLMFVAGVMNLLWMAGIAAYMLLEKAVPTGPRGNWLSWTTGSVLVGGGVWFLAVAAA